MGCIYLVRLDFCFYSTHSQDVQSKPLPSHAVYCMLWWRSERFNEPQHSDIRNNYSKLLFKKIYKILNKNKFNLKMLILDLIFAALILIQIFLLLYENEEYSPIIDGKTIIELKIMADSYLTNPDKVSMIAQEIETIDWSKVEQWQKDALIEKLIKTIDNN